MEDCLNSATEVFDKLDRVFETAEDTGNGFTGSDDNRIKYKIDSSEEMFKKPRDPSSEVQQKWNRVEKGIRKRFAFVKNVLLLICKARTAS